MIGLIGLVVSIGLADSLNPATVGPAVYLATRPARIRRVAEFTASFFAVNLVAGIALALGPGRLVLALVPEPGHTAKHVFELVAGIVLLAGAGALWLGRERLAGIGAERSPRGGSATALGASIAAIELPTAAPYFVVIAAVAGSGAAIPAQVALLALFNAVFVLPLLVLLLVLVVLGDRAEPVLGRVNTWLEAHWPVLLGALLGLVGLALAIVGAAGLVRG